MEPYKLKLLLVLVGFLAVVGLPLLWLSWRKGKQQALERGEELATFANNVGGTVADAGGHVLPWSVALEPPFLGEHEGAMAMVTVASGPQFVHALEFERNGWAVRVCEATVEVRNLNATDNASTRDEHRIEVATAELVPMKIVVGRGTERGLLRKWAARMPRTVAEQERPLWMELNLPETAGHLAFTSDLPQAGEVLNGHVAAWLHAHADGTSFSHLTFEAGVVHSSLGGPIDERSVLRRVDALLDLLDRIPGSRPARPATAV